MKNAVFWDIKTQFVPHRKHYASAIEPSQLMLSKILGFQGGDYEECPLLRCDSVRRMSEAICSPETSVLKGVTRRHNPEDGILHK
jgi:hypothetical protein